MSGVGGHEHGAQVHVGLCRRHPAGHGEPGNGQEQPRITIGRGAPITLNQGRCRGRGVAGQDHPFGDPQISKRG